MSAGNSIDNLNESISKSSLKRDMYLKPLTLTKNTENDEISKSRNETLNGHKSSLVTLGLSENAAKLE